MPRSHARDRLSLVPAASSGLLGPPPARPALTASPRSLRRREVSDDEKNDNCKNARSWFHVTYRSEEEGGN